RAARRHRRMPPRRAPAGGARDRKAGTALGNLAGNQEGNRRKGGQITAMPAPLVSLEQISKRFGAIVVAERVDLRLGQGEALGIIGPNGAGKTTLFGIISGTIAPDSGRVVYTGRDITGLTPAQRCALGIGRSFQIPQ